jgi:hypothetical protein
VKLDAYVHAPFEGSPWRWVDGLEAFGVEVMRLAALSVTTPTLDAWDAAERVLRGEPTWPVRAYVAPHVDAWLAGHRDDAALTQARAAMAKVVEHAEFAAQEWGGGAEQLRDERAGMARALHAVLCALDASATEEDVVMAGWDALRGCGEAVSGFERGMPEFVGAFVLRHAVNGDG